MCILVHTQRLHLRLDVQNGVYGNVWWIKEQDSLPSALRGNTDHGRLVLLCPVRERRGEGRGGLGRIMSGEG